MKWEEKSFGEFFQVKHGYAFRSKYFSDEGNHILLTPGNFCDAGGFKYKEGKEKFYTGDIPEGYILKEGDLIIAMTEQADGLLGSSAMIPLDNRFLHNQRLGLVTNLQSNNLDKAFLYYLFNTTPVRSQIRASASGTKVRHTAPERISKVKFLRPPIGIQRKIAYILSAYDHLIENNFRQIKLLEESARLLYKEWFVRLRFPGYEHTSIIKGVPEGWEKKSLSDIASVVMGQSPESRHYNDVGEGLPFHQGVSNFGERFISHSIYCRVTNRIAEPGDILCSVRAPVGRLNITIDKIIIGRGLAAMRSKLGTHSFLYYQLRNHFFKEDMIGGGAIFASVTKKQLESQRLLTPTVTIMKEFEEFTQPIDREIKCLFVQHQKLKQARDILLPKLMSGEMGLDNLNKKSRD